MSIAINPDGVFKVWLIGATEPWNIEPGSFYLDSYEYVDTHDFVQHGGGNSGVCATGFSFKTKDGTSRVSGPLTSIAAVQEAI